MRYSELTESLEDLLPRYKRSGIDAHDLFDMAPRFSSAQDFADHVSTPGTATYQRVERIWNMWKEKDGKPPQHFLVPYLASILRDKLGATFSKQAKEPDWETSQMIFSGDGYILGGDGWRVFLDATFLKDKIGLSEILVKDAGSGLGSKIMNLLKEIADEKGIGIEVYKVVNDKFFGKFPWLEKTGGMSYVYRPKKYVSEGVIKVPKNLMKNIELYAVRSYIEYVNSILTAKAYKAKGTTDNFRQELSKILNLYKITNVDLSHTPPAYGFWENSDIGEINGHPITLVMTVDREKKNTYRGQYIIKTKTIHLVLSNIFDLNEGAIDTDSILYKPGHITNYITSVFNRGIRNLRGTIEHELAHAVQYLQYADKDARQIDTDDEYHNQNVEFYPMIISHAHIFLSKFGDEKAAKRIATRRKEEFSAAIKAYLGIGKPTIIEWGAFDLKFSPAVFFEKIRNKVGMFNFKKAAREFVKAVHMYLNEPVTESLTEGRDYPLYHFMDSHKGEATFSNNTMEARWVHNIPGLGNVKGNSFTRNPRLDHGSIILLTMDHTKLAQRHKIIPVDGERVFANRDRPEGAMVPDIRGDRHGRSFTWSEEFVIGDIKNFNRYVKKIEIRGDQWRQIISYKKVIEIIIDTKAYADKFNIPFYIDPKFLSELMKNIDRDRQEDEEEVDPALDGYAATLKSLAK
jgi:hypothetical protein